MELDNLTQALRSSGGDDAAARIAALLEGIPESGREEWLARADLCAALGFAWAEARAVGKPLRYSFGRADREYKDRWCNPVPVFTV